MIDIFKTFSFTANCDNEEIENLEELKDIVAKIGVRIKIKKYEKEDRTYFIYFDYDKKEVGEKLTRNAGSKKGRGQNPDRLTWGEVEKLLESNTVTAVAEKLKMSRYTLYRRMKKKTEWQEPTDIFY